MGMSAAQAKLLSLTARRSDINYQLSSLMRGKLDLMTQASNAADMLADSKRNNNIFVLTTSDNTQTELSFNSLSKEGLTIVDAKGRTIVPSSYKTNPKGLTSILPASHPSVKSYDGDFVVKDKLNKNYVSIPQNQIPIFDNSKDFQQKYVKKFESEDKEVISLNNIDTTYETIIRNVNTTCDDARLQCGTLASAFQSSSLGFVISNENSFKDFTSYELDGVSKNNKYEHHGYTTYSGTNCTNSEKLSKILQANFKSEFGGLIDTNNSIGKINNILMGGSDSSVTSYTKYENRIFQFGESQNQAQSFAVTWNSSNSAIQKHNTVRQSGNSNITYVSNAEQLITALLKDAKMEGGELVSNANIMLLNDIDLDDMLQDSTTGKKGLKEFIQNEISSLELDSADESKKTAYNNAMNTFSDVTNRVYNNENWANNKNNICNMFENLVTAYGIPTSALSGNNIIEKINNISDDVTTNWSSEQKQFRNNAKDLYKLFNVIEHDKNDITLSNGAKLTKNECSNWSKLSSQIAAAAAAAAAVGGTKSKKSGIDASVLANVYSKYFSGGTSDKFDENFTNFIQIDKFKGSIGGGGFAINNLKMLNNQKDAASMFNTLENATIHGVFMENAAVISNSKDTRKAAILAQNVTGNSLTYLTVRGQSRVSENFSYNTLENIANGLNSAHEDYRNVSIVAQEKRTGQNLKTVYGDFEMDSIMRCDNGEQFLTGWNFDMMNKEVDASGFMGLATERNYGTTSMGISCKSADLGDQMNVCMYNSNNCIANVAHSNTAKRKNGSEIGDIRVGNFAQRKLVGGYASAALLSAAQSLSGQIGDKNGKTVDNISLFNGKIRLCQTTTETKYSKDNEISDWDADIDWDEWEYVDDNVVNDDGTVALVKKHGEETEEYLSVMSLLEFYKEQGVNIDINEDRESGFLTYSAYGYSVDVEYKDDLEKYNSDPYLYKVENNDSSLLIYERDKVNDVDISQLVFVDDIEALLDKNIKNGVWFIQGASVSDAAKFERKSLDEIGISETTDENADNIAQAEYERKMRDIELQEEKFDAQITELENTLKGIEQEIENQQKIVKQNIQSSFSTFAS